jgi:hypothetical protein
VTHFFSTPVFFFGEKRKRVKISAKSFIYRIIARLREVWSSDNQERKGTWFRLIMISEESGRGIGCLYQIPKIT